MGQADFGFLGVQFDRDLFLNTGTGFGRLSQVDPAFHFLELDRCVIRGVGARISFRGVPETVAADNIKSLAMVFGAIESARLGRVVEIAP